MFRKELYEVVGVADSMKNYFKDEVEFLSGIGVVYTEFIGEVATRQINILAGEYFASSSLHDRNEKIGYFLYDGKKSDLDLSNAIKIKSDEFEKEWLSALNINNLTNDIVYKKGDASEPMISPVMIIHIVNNLGKWGKGFVLSLSKKYPPCKMEYLNLYKKETKPNLGYIQIINVDNDNKIYVANMFAQDGIKKNSSDNKIYLSYEALSDCLAKVADYCLANRILSVQMPLIGSGLAGGDWNEIKEIIKNELCYKNIKCYVIVLD